MKIKKGYWFMCVKKITLDEVVIYKKGVIYKSNEAGFLLDEKELSRFITPNHLKGYFIKLK